jgi:hypothetical protein
MLTPTDAGRTSISPPGPEGMLLLGFKNDEP